MIKLVSLLLQFCLTVWGENIVARWLAEIRFWWETHNDKRIKMMADIEYRKLNLRWRLYLEDRNAHSSSDKDLNVPSE